MSLAMELFLIDAIGPFFRGCGRMRVNWSKIPFMDLLDASPDDWAAIGEELREFARQVSAQGYNAVTLDDLAHLAPHPLHEPEVADRIDFLRGKFTGFFDMLHGKYLIFRTWTVGAHRIGDLIWHRGTLEKTLEGLDSPNLIVSMKHGEGDFFRYLPLNRAFFRAFFRVKKRKLLELQARREYEGAGEYPSFIGWACEGFARELSQVENVVGISVWCQTGGWHRFRRRAYLEADGRDIWIRLNTEAAITVFRHGKPADSAVESLLGPERAFAALELLDHADTVIRELLYIRDFARQKLFFRRVRIPPLLHVYWDSLFINHGVRKVMRIFC